jgi:cytochrome o ubiquinol oxidase subunit 2
MFSGDGFPDMNFQLRAVPAAEFNQWVAQARGGGPVLDDAAYRQLAQQSRNERPFTYSAADPGIFDRLVMRQIPPGPGPPTGMGGGKAVKEIGGEGRISGNRS